MWLMNHSDCSSDSPLCVLQIGLSVNQFREEIGSSVEMSEHLKMQETEKQRYNKVNNCMINLNATCDTPSYTENKLQFQTKL